MNANRQTSRPSGKSSTSASSGLGPPYTFKLVKGKGKRERIEVLTPCVSYTIVKQWEDGEDEDDPGHQMGWELLLTRYPPLEGQVVYLPQDAHTVYVENANGKTVQSFRWPEKQKDKDKREAQFRVMDTDRQEERS